MRFEKLEQNIIDMIKEEQAKLGYRKESIRLYYPLSSLVHLTGENAGSVVRIWRGDEGAPWRRDCYGEKGPLLLPDPGGGRCVCEGAYQSE